MKQDKLNSYPLWSPRFWHGMRLGAYVRLLWRNRFRIHPIRWPMAAGLFGVTAFNSLASPFQQLIYGRRIRDTQLTAPPIFIIGHWRSGTTHLHELMSRDDRLACPTTFECFAPYHFLVTGWCLPKLFWILLPRKRPMDNMPTGFDRPQEDEFALCSMGAPTPYYRTGFPNHAPPYQEFLDMQDVAPRDLQWFREALEYFMKAVSLKHKKRLLMKSPPHTGRVELLADMFPGARFIHISRNPYEIFASTRRLWRAMDWTQGFQLPKHRDLDEYIFDCFERMYRGFHQQRPRLDPAHVCDVRYEDLVQDPVGQVQAIYQRLDLGDFNALRPQLEEYVEGQKDYQPNRHQLDPEIKHQIATRWSDYFERYGYETET